MAPLSSESDLRGATKPVDSTCSGHQLMSFLTEQVHAVLQNAT